MVMIKLLNLYFYLTSIKINFKEQRVNYLKYVLYTVIIIYSYSSEVYAFYYEEHKLITQKALTIANSMNYVSIDQELIKKGINSNFLCSNLMEVEPYNCFTIADLPALAGDHAGSPMLMQFKWFNDTRASSYNLAVNDYLASFRVFSEQKCQSSETTISKIPNRSEFAVLMHKNPNANSFAADHEISSNDSNYVRSAAHNCNHFRNPNIKNIDLYNTEIIKNSITTIWNKPTFIPYVLSEYLTILQSQRRERFKPKLEAGVWYAQLHATALELASYNDETSLAAAWLFETFALHFIQDGVASGHIATKNNGGIKIIDTKVEHDRASSNGLSVTIENACLAINGSYMILQDNFPQLTDVCQDSNFETVLYGDRNLIKQSHSPTQDLAIFLTLISLQEFGESISKQQPKIDEQFLADDFDLDPHWTFQGQGDGKLAKLLFTWWESGGKTNQTTSPMSIAAEQHAEEGNLKALFMWPIPKND